jgi:hypothetical protein
MLPHYIDPIQLDLIITRLWYSAMLSIGVVQQLMSANMISPGALHYNDWYHIGVILFIIGLHLMFTKTDLMNNLNNI